MNFNLDDKQLQSVLSTAVLGMITPENRDALIKQAVVDLMKPAEGGNYRSDRRSAMAVAFDNAAQDVAQKLMHEILSADAGFRTELEKMVAEAVKKVTIDKRTEFIEHMATALVNGMKLER